LSENYTQRISQQDIPLLTHAFLEKMGAEHNMRSMSIDKKFEDNLMEYD
jgi:DNA-binding NtrC family response regulator